MLETEFARRESTYDDSSMIALLVNFEVRWKQISTLLIGFRADQAAVADSRELQIACGRASKEAVRAQRLDAATWQRSCTPG